jgi:hypothetical protein
MLQLRDHLHWCDCEGRAVFLDTLADRYFCLPHDANAAFLQLAHGGGREVDRERLRLLEARGLLLPGNGVPFRGAPELVTPARDLPRNAGVAARPGRLLQLLAAELHSAWALRTRSFHTILEAARAAPARRAIPTIALGEIAWAADTIALVTRSHDRCLVRALAVHALCRRSGNAARLVVGVTAHPFAAHCWVQRGADVVVGGYEQARLFTPILVVE